MEDADLQAIRQARLAELQRNAGGGSSAGGPSPSFLGSLGAGPQGGARGGDDQAAQQEERKREMLSQILDNEARERLSRIALVKPQKSRQITELLLRMAQSGQIRQRVTEPQLIGLLDQLDQNGAENEPKITITRKKQAVEDDDDDFDL